MCVFVGVCLTGGCQDPAYKAKQAARYQCIRHIRDVHAAREAKRPASLEALSKLVEKRHETRDQQLNTTIRHAKEGYLQDQRDWQAQAALRRERCRSSLAGRPAGIPVVWRTMTY